MVPYNQVKRIWCDLHRTSSHDNADCREQQNGHTPYQFRRSSGPRPHYNGRAPAPAPVDSNMIGNMVQQQLFQALSSMVNTNGKRPAQNQQPMGYIQRGAPGTEHSNAYRHEKHCYYCGRDDHYIADCLSRKGDEEKMQMMAWRPQMAQGSTALAIMGSSSSDTQPQPVHYMPAPGTLPNASPYGSNARDIGPQPKMH
ncbi:hypothetical protein EDC01DRAFT_635782 [Geopyxis carbonaria]|nr:hypothetical protein EDC01DRAFT_635782 [Geopyxis carbonaria]